MIVTDSYPSAGDGDGSEDYFDDGYDDDDDRDDSDEEDDDDDSDCKDDVADDAGHGFLQDPRIRSSSVSETMRRARSEPLGTLACREFKRCNLMANITTGVMRNFDHANMLD